MKIQYVGENLLPGNLGQLLVIIAFGTALLSTIAYYFSTNNTNELESNSWKNIARWSFRIHSVALVGIVAALFYIIYNHHFEYYYAWAHSSKELPTHYIISCFWEGQEGSFLLWGFWQLVIGNILIRIARSWESSVMTFVGLSQVFIMSMLIGIELLGQRIGSSPFILLRDAVEGPVFSRPDYLAFITDGNGLNPLLQNYWMVIHPPTLFFGFASMIVPFAYALSGVWTQRYKEWIQPALPWALIAVMVLGTGIIMGSFWAYEALNFGGFWAWDPVENASIIPWLILIAAVHVMIAYRSTGHSYFTTLFLVYISFISVLYASFLTRSGVLGEASVHSFTDLGMSGQLIFYILAFLIIGVYLFVKHWKNFPITQKDEQTYSREFWLFIGALIMTISCLQVLVSTSIPVYNAVFGTNVAPPTDPIQHYNKWQLPIAVLIMLVSGFSQYLKFKNTDSKKFYISIAIPAVLAIFITAGFVYLTGVYENLMYIILVYASTFSILSNAKIMGDAFKGNMKLAGSAVAHIGFAIMLVGALVAASQSNAISINTAGIDFGKDFDAKNKRENILLWKDEPVQMERYMVTYLGDSTSGPNIFYKVNYKELDKNGKIKDEFNLFPNAQINPKMGLIASPDTRHYLLHDVYTHVTSVPKKETHSPDDGHDHDGNEGYLDPVDYTIAVGDTIRFKDGRIVLLGTNTNVPLRDLTLAPGDFALGLIMQVNMFSGEQYTLEPVLVSKGGVEFSLPKMEDAIGLRLNFSQIFPDTKSYKVMVQFKEPEPQDYIIMKAIVFPYINLLWGGTIIMVIGFLLAIFRRSKELVTVK